MRHSSVKESGIVVLNVDETKKLIVPELDEKVLEEAVVALNVGVKVFEVAGELNFVELENMVDELFEVKVLDVEKLVIGKLVRKML